MIRSHRIGLRLCGIADEPFCPLPNGSTASRHLGPLQVADLDRDLLGGRRDQRQHRDQEGVAVALHDLVRDRRGLRARARRRRAPRPRAAGGRRSRPRPRACRRAPPSRADASRSCWRSISANQTSSLQPEGDRLGVHAVGPPDHRGAAVRLGEGAQSAPDRAPAGVDQRRRRAPGCTAERGVEQVRRGHAAVQIGLLRAEALAHLGQERDHVVVHDRLDLEDPRPDRAAPCSRIVSAVPRGSAPGLLHGAHRGDLDLEPGAKARLVGPELAHLGQGVAFDHGLLVPRRPSGRYLRSDLFQHDRDVAPLRRRARS